MEVAFQAVVVHVMKWCLPQLPSSPTRKGIKWDKEERATGRSTDKQTNQYKEHQKMIELLVYIYIYITDISLSFLLYSILVKTCTDRVRTILSWHKSTRLSPVPSSLWTSPLLKRSATQRFCPSIACVRTLIQTKTILRVDIVYCVDPQKLSIEMTLFY